MQNLEAEILRIKDDSKPSADYLNSLLSKGLGQD